MTHSNKTPIITWFRFVAGILIMGAMGYTWIFVKEFDVWLFAIPAALMGVNPAELFRPRR